MRQRYAYDANESTRRLVEGGMSTGLTNTPTARGFSVLYHVFITLKQCILCSALRHKSYLTLLCVTSIRDFFCLGTFSKGSIWLPPRTLASSQGETSPTHFEQYECGFSYVPVDLTNERPQSNFTSQWRDHQDLNWDKVSNHSQNDLTSFFKRPLLLVRPGFKPTTTTTKTTTTLLYKNTKVGWFAPQIAGKLVVADRQDGPWPNPTWANRTAHF